MEQCFLDGSFCNADFPGSHRSECRTLMHTFELMDNLILYKIGNYFFIVFHVVLIFFNLFGWIPKKLRKWNLVSLILTAFSWIVLGIFYGFGYCFLTDWHWGIREKLGYTNKSHSYIHFLISELTGITISERTVDVVTAVSFFSALAISIYLNIRQAVQRKKTDDSRFGSS